MIKSGIYSITNLINNKKYIGSTINFSNRWSRHKHNLNRNNHCNEHLKNAWTKYGYSNFKFEVIEYVSDLSILIEREQFWINNIKPEYNKRLIAENNIGFKMTEEQKERRKNSGKYKNRIVTDEWKKRMSESAYNRDPINEETKKKMSESKKGIIPKNLSELHNNRKKCVYQFKDGLLVNKYESTVKASLDSKINRGNIGECCLGKRKNAGGFNWSYKNKIDQ